MVILSELIVPLIGGTLRVVETLLLLGSGVAVTAPEVTGPGYAASRSAMLHHLSWPIRAGARHPRWVAVVLGAVAISVVALWRP